MYFNKKWRENYNGEHLLITGVEVAFQEPVLTVGESDGSVSVCTILIGQTEREVLVTYATLNGSAGGRLIYTVCNWLMAYCSQI